MYAGSSILSQTKINLTTADDLYNLNAGVVGIRSGGNMDVRSISGSWETSSAMTMKNGSMTITSAAATTISSGATSGWKTTGELWFKGSKVYLNTDGKVVADATAPTPPEINPAFDLYKQPNAIFDNNVKRWFAKNGEFESVAPFTPTHEPWARATGTKKFVNGTVEKPTSQG